MSQVLVFHTLRTAAHDIKPVMAKKNPAAVELGRKGGKATARTLTPDQRKEAARKAAKARWAKKKNDR
jgi:hypothetical protein